MVVVCVVLPVRGILWERRRKNTQERFGEREEVTLIS